MLLRANSRKFWVVPRTYSPAMADQVTSSVSHYTHKDRSINNL